MRIAETVLLAAGVLMIVASALLLTIRHRWKRVLTLPAGPRHTFDPVDLIAGLMAIWLLPGVCLEVFAWAAGEAIGTGASAAQAADALVSPHRTLAIAVGQTGATIALLIIGGRRVAGGVAAWGLTLKRMDLQLLRAVATYVMSWPVCTGLLYLTIALITIVYPHYVPADQSAIQTLRSEDAPAWMTALTVVSALVLAPIVEELFFRGLLQPMVARLWGSEWWAIVFTGCAFGAFHFGTTHVVPALAVFGMILGYLYAKTRSLTQVMLLHAVFNAKTLLWVALSESG